MQYQKNINIRKLTYLAMLTALVCMVVELCTNNGFDTVSCPAAAMLIIIPLVKILGG